MSNRIYVVLNRDNYGCQDTRLEKIFSTKEAVEEFMDYGMRSFNMRIVEYTLNTENEYE